MGKRKTAETRQLAIATEEAFGGVSEFTARLEVRWPLSEEVPPVFVRRVRDRCRVLECDLRMLRARLDVRLRDEADLAELLAGRAPVVQLEQPRSPTPAAPGARPVRQTRAA